MPVDPWTPQSGQGRRRSFVFAAGLLTALSFGPAALAQDADASAGPGQQAIDQNRQEAIEIVRGMARYISGEPDIALAYDSALEVVTPQLEKLQFNSSGKAAISRPDKFRISRVGGYADVEMIYDGAQVTIFDRTAKLYASQPMTGPIDSVVDRLRGELRLDFPAADLLIADSFNALMDDVLEAKHIGQAVVGGVDCEHVAFRNHDTDWQLWVEAGAQPIPCKVVITSKTVAAAPQYSIRFTDWQTGEGFPASTFAFTPPEGARKVDFDSLAEIDEVPSGVAVPPASAAKPPAGASGAKPGESK